MDPLLGEPAFLPKHKMLADVADQAEAVERVVSFQRPLRVIFRPSFMVVYPLSRSRTQATNNSQITARTMGPEKAR